jgi:hypothetical protein
MAVLQLSAPWLYFSRFRSEVLILIQVLAVAGAILLLAANYRRFPPRRRGAADEDGRFQSALEWSGCLLAAIILLALWYTFSSRAHYFYARYFSPLLLLVIPLASFILLQLYHRYQVRRLALLLPAGLTFFFLTVMAVLHIGRGYAGNTMYREQLTLIQKRVPAAEVVAATQSGTIGYFRDRVVNLDGKVNPHVLEYKDRLPQYLRDINLRWLCDWPWMLKMHLGEEPEQLGWLPVESRGDFVIYHYEPGGAEADHE